MLRHQPGQFVIVLDLLVVQLLPIPKVQRSHVILDFFRNFSKVVACICINAPSGLEEVLLTLAQQ